MNHEETVAAVHNMKEAIRKLSDAYSQQVYAPENCPLQVDGEGSHMEMSQILRGLGRWGWQCPLCGKEFVG